MLKSPPAMAVAISRILRMGRTTLLEKTYTGAAMMAITPAMLINKATNRLLMAARTSPRGLIRNTAPITLS